MPSRPLVGVWLVTVCFAHTDAIAQDRTEQEIVDAIVRESPQAAALRATVDVVRREQATRTLLPNPTLTYTREGAGFTEFFQAEQLLPTFGTRALLARAGVAAVEAAEAERDVGLWQLRSTARNAVARLAGEQDRLGQAAAAVADIEELINVLRTREQEGEGSRFDRLRAEQELSDARQAVLTAGINVATARAELVALLPAGVTVDRVSATSSSGSLPPIDALVQRASTARAELRALQRAAQRFAIEADAARRAQRPMPSVMGGFKRADSLDGRDVGGTVGVTINVPLFNHGSREAARWEAERQRVERERAARDAEIRAEITRAHEIVDSHQRALLDPAFSRNSGEELVQIAVTAYREGEVGILELLDAYRTAARARARVIDVTLGARVAQIALERAVGEPLWP